MRFIVAAVVLLTATLAAQGQAQAQAREYNAARRQPGNAEQATDSIVVKWRSTAAKTATAAVRTQKATAAAGVSLQKRQGLTTDIDVMQAPQKLSGAALDAMLARLQADPDVEYAAANLRRHAHALTSDPRLQEQWYLLDSEIAATRTNLAWDVTTGDASVIVAVLDTGVRPEHPDLNGKLLAGYDFVSNTLVANDGDARDADPQDPGDWVSATDLQNSFFSSNDCAQGPSSWHGTRVSGLIGAATDEGVGVAGAAWNTRILPVRVLGKCGGLDSDIVAGILWAAGVAVDGVPTNPNPANIINLSLGGTGTCYSLYTDAINTVTARGVLVVASAGNDGGPVSVPANCDNVLGVAGIRHVGTKVGYSSLGTEIGIGAPAGNCVNTAVGESCVYQILVPIDTGLTTPVASDYSPYTITASSDEIGPNIGTSFSAPLVAAAAALVQSIDSTLTPAQTTLLLQESATTYPTSSSTSSTACRVPTGANDVQADECVCTTRTCGAGMLNASAAVLATQGPLAVASSSGTVNPGVNITLDGSASFATSGRSVTTFLWSVVDGGGAAPTIATPGQSTTTVQVTGTGTFTLRLTVTDNQGAQDSDDITLTSTSATSSDSPTFSDGGGGGGGGGALGWELLALVLLAGRRRWRAST